MRTNRLSRFPESVEEGFISNEFVPGDVTPEAWPHGCLSFLLYPPATACGLFHRREGNIPIVGSEPQISNRLHVRMAA
jgi:hypothetical protein